MIRLESMPHSERMEWLRDRHRGERIVIVANGPSLNRMDLSALKQETVMAMNKGYLGFKQFGFYPRYYVAINPKVLLQSRDQISALRCVKFIGSHGVAAGIDEDALTYRINTEQPPARFSTDLSVGMHEGWTVTYAALQIAYYLGFSTAVLIGLDHRYQFTGEPNEGSFLRGADPNHFSPEYFGNQEWDHPDLARSEESYRIARQVYEQAGRQIIDATIDGACQIFRKQDFQRVLRGA